MKLSARNTLSGTIVDIKEGAVTSHVKLDVGSTIITAAITNEAVHEMGLQKGQAAVAVIKSSDVMIGIDE